MQNKMFVARYFTAKMRTRNGCLIVCEPLRLSGFAGGERLQVSGSGFRVSGSGLRDLNNRILNIEVLETLNLEP